MDKNVKESNQNNDPNKRRNKNITNMKLFNWSIIFRTFPAFKFKILRTITSKKAKIKVLDVGCSNSSSLQTKCIFPNSMYHGIDIEDISLEKNNLIDKFYLMDFTLLDFKVIPKKVFDIMIFSHVTEHLKNGEDVILNLLPKLRSNGTIYIEFPSSSVNFPSIRNINIVNKNKIKKTKTSKVYAHPPIQTDTLLIPLFLRFSFVFLCFILNFIHNVTLFSR